MLIYVQLPAPDPMKVLQRRLKEEEHFDEMNQRPGFRTEYLKGIIAEINKPVTCKNKTNE